MPTVTVTPEEWKFVFFDGSRIAAIGEKLLGEIGLDADVTVNVDDAAAGPLPAAGSWGAANSTVTVDPTNHNELVADSFPAPAPPPSSEPTLATFNGTDPDGTWSLYVLDDAAPDSGSIAGGWCLTLTAAKATPTITTQASDGGPVGTSVTDTATSAPCFSRSTRVRWSKLHRSRPGR